MASEILLRGSLKFAKTGRGDGMSVAISSTFAGTLYQKRVLTIATLAGGGTAIWLAGVVAGWCFIKNLDATNFVTLHVGAGELDFMKIKAGEFALFRFSDNNTSPHAFADTAAVEIEILMLDD